MRCREFLLAVTALSWVACATHYDVGVLHFKRAQLLASTGEYEHVSDSYQLASSYFSRFVNEHPHSSKVSHALSLNKESLLKMGEAALIEVDINNPIDESLPPMERIRASQRKIWEYNIHLLSEETRSVFRERCAKNAELAWAEVEKAERQDRLTLATAIAAYLAEPLAEDHPLHREYLRLQATARAYHQMRAEKAAGPASRNFHLAMAEAAQMNRAGFIISEDGNERSIESYKKEHRSGFSWSTEFRGGKGCEPLNQFILDELGDTKGAPALSLVVTWDTCRTFRNDFTTETRKTITVDEPYEKTESRIVFEEVPYKMPCQETTCVSRDAVNGSCSNSVTTGGTCSLTRIEAREVVVKETAFRPVDKEITVVEGNSHYGQTAIGTAEVRYGDITVSVPLRYHFENTSPQSDPNWLPQWLPRDGAKMATEILGQLAPIRAKMASEHLVRAEAAVSEGRMDEAEELLLTAGWSGNTYQKGLEIWMEERYGVEAFEVMKHLRTGAPIHVGPTFEKFYYFRESFPVHESALRSKRDSLILHVCCDRDRRNCETLDLERKCFR